MYAARCSACTDCSDRVARIDGVGVGGRRLGDTAASVVGESLVAGRAVAHTGSRGRVGSVVHRDGGAGVGSPYAGVVGYRGWDGGGVLCAGLLHAHTRHPARRRRATTSTPRTPNARRTSTRRTSMRRTWEPPTLTTPRPASRFWPTSMRRRSLALIHRRWATNQRIDL